jgi:2-dehydro-3-deoxyphosphogluconate aldolase/(4S)-4-hydroxy-2-oxoglutarate aldolase
LESVEGLRRELPEGVEIGIGTVTSPDQARAAIETGADFIVTPVTDSAIVMAAAAAAGIPAYSGGLTPTEIHMGWAAGAAAVKVFPASVVGPGYLSQLRGPFPGIELLPSGGVDIDDIPQWMSAGALAVSLGSPLIGDAFKGGSMAALRDRAARALELAGENRVQP